MQLDLKRISRTITAALFGVQSLTSAATIAIATVGSIVATALSGDQAQAGLPSAVSNLASAPAAFLFGLLWDRIGRRWGLALGLVFGGIGAGLALLAIWQGSFALLLFAFAGMGISRAATQLSRFIAAEVSPPSQRALAISYVVFGGTVGAVGGPLLVDPSSRWALVLGFNDLAGPFLVSVLLFILAILVTIWGLWPEPQGVAAQVTALYPEADDRGETAVRSLGTLLRLQPVQVAVVAMVLAQVVMIMVMGMTSLYMKQHEHALGAISIVFSAHTLGMFAFSVLTGRLADRWGRGPVIIAGSLMNLAAFALAPLSTDTAALVAALFLLGLGWNFCFVAGSALLADQLSPAERSSTQGANDLLIGLASAGGSYGSGLLYAAGGYGLLNLVAAGLAVPILLLTIVWQWKVNPTNKKY